jgi:hypothetical protein
MSDYTDYLIYQTTATSPEALRAEIAAFAPPRTVIYPGFDESISPDDLAARLTGAPVWVALMSADAPSAIDPRPGSKHAAIFVLEDLASWRVDAQCGAQGPVVLYFGGPDGYGEDWFGNNDPRFQGLATSLTAERLTALQACFDLPAAELAPLLAHGRIWDFLRAVDAPAGQMADQGLVHADDFPADLPIAFAWELWPEIYDQDM